jgi:hypothetical protein
MLLHAQYGHLLPVDQCWLLRYHQVRYSGQQHALPPGQKGVSRAEFTLAMLISLGRIKPADIGAQGGFLGTKFSWQLHNIKGAPCGLDIVMLAFAHFSWVFAFSGARGPLRPATVSVFRGTKFSHLKLFTV